MMFTYGSCCRMPRPADARDLFLGLGGRRLLRADVRRRLKAMAHVHNGAPGRASSRTRVRRSRTYYSLEVQTRGSRHAFGHRLVAERGVTAAGIAQTYSTA